MKCPVEQVYKATERLKVNYKKAINREEAEASQQLEAGIAVPRYFYHHHVLEREDPRFKQLVHDHIEREDIYSLKRPGSRRPSPSTSRASLPR